MEIIQNKPYTNRLQEYIQLIVGCSNTNSVIQYDYIEKCPFHVTRISLKYPINGFYGYVASGEGLTKKESKQEAARLTLNKLKKNAYKCPMDIEGCEGTPTDEHLHLIWEMIKK
jgi:dsRNA-specific ribonuclease